MPACSSCGQENPEIARFCFACGAALRTNGATGREERRVVSVVFVDLAGFTSRAERLDPEDVRAILTPYYECVRSELESFGGTVEKFVGDAVVGIFGAPIAYGDDPERAVRAALAIREALNEMNERHDLELKARIAVNTGEAVVALEARPERGEGMVVGDVINTAARLQAGAPLEGVLVGAETYACTRSAILYREAAPVVARGKAEPLEVWLALRAIMPAGERVLSRVPMVGRARELELLQRVWEQVCQTRRPHLVTVLGPSGIGKSRLGAEFARVVELRGGRSLRGRSFAYGTSAAYGAFAQHVKQIARIYDSDDPAVATTKLREAVVELGATDDVDDVAGNVAVMLGLETEESAADREALFFAARRFVESVAREQPTLLVFEDVHWADSSMLDLVQSLAARVRDVPLLLLALTRPELLTARKGWGGGLVSYTALALEPLDEAESRELAAHLLADAADEHLDDVPRLALAGEGNPLFIEELAATLVEGSKAADELPTTIRALVSARLDALPAGERAVLLDAAVVGKIFWRGALERLAGPGDALEAAIATLEERDLIRREQVSRLQSDRQYTFKHALIRDIAYATVPRAVRRERHAVVARFLEETTAVAADSAGALAHHWRQAGDDERALHYLLLAADQASRGWAKERALALYKEAAELVPEGDPRVREIQLRRAVVTQALYHVPDAARLASGDEPPPAAEA